MSSTPPPPPRFEAALVAAVRTLFLFLKSLTALDLSLLAIIAILAVVSPITKNATLYILRVVLVALGSLFAAVNSYLLTASWLPSVASPGPITIAAVEIINGIAPIVTDSVLLAHIIEDDVNHGTSLMTVAYKMALPVSLKIGRTGDAAMYIVERVKVVLAAIDVCVDTPLSPAASEKLGCALQLGDNIYSLIVFLHGVHKERTKAASTAALPVTTSVLASQSTASLLFLATINFVSPILLGSAQLAALLDDGHEDNGAMLPLYFDCVKTLLQLVGAHSASFLVALQRRRNRLQTVAHALLSERRDRVIGSESGNNDGSDSDGVNGSGGSAQGLKVPQETTALRTSEASSRSYSMLPRHWTTYSKAFNPNLSEAGEESRQSRVCARETGWQFVELHRHFL
ncbi:hypothetical protein OF83DRAFT_1172318 [Amylostereum chailletii]|nr:hypothetical protein OF83DRAFT_1172318 [Amylostereum chailletii]